MKIFIRYIHRSIGVHIRAVTVKWSSAHGVLNHGLRDAQVIRLARFLGSNKVRAEGFWEEESQPGGEGLLQHKFNNGYGYCLLRPRCLQITTNTLLELYNFVLFSISMIERWKLEEQTCSALC